MATQNGTSGVLEVDYAIEQYADIVLHYQVFGRHGVLTYDDAVMWSSSVM